MKGLDKRLLTILCIGSFAVLLASLSGCSGSINTNGRSGERDGGSDYRQDQVGTDPADVPNDDGGGEASCEMDCYLQFMSRAKGCAAQLCECMADCSGFEDWDCEYECLDDLDYCEDGIDIDLEDCNRLCPCWEAFDGCLDECSETDLSCEGVCRRAYDECTGMEIDADTEQCIEECFWIKRNCYHICEYRHHPDDWEGYLSCVYDCEAAVVDCELACRKNEPPPDGGCVPATREWGGTCSAVDQCGCPPDSWCVVEFSPEACQLVETCASEPPGSLDVDDECDTARLDECRPGTYCFGTCAQWCRTDADCSSSEMRCIWFDIVEEDCGQYISPYHVCA